MSTVPDFAKLVPGFDFLQGLMKTAGGALPGVPNLPGMNQWIAPTLNPEELEKRIGELRTVQFWLEQNAKLLGTTIQAMEVQRMTLSTLKSMNVPMADLREAMTLRMPEVPRAQAEAPARPAPASEAPSEAAPPAVDPMQWWGALTQQFSELAANALKDGRADAARQLAGAMVKQSLDAAGETLKKAVGTPVKAAPAKKTVAKKTAAKTAATKTRTRAG